MCSTQASLRPPQSELPITVLIVWFTAGETYYRLPKPLAAPPTIFQQIKSTNYGCHIYSGCCLSYWFYRCVHRSWRSHQWPDEKLQFAGLKSLHGKLCCVEQKGRQAPFLWSFYVGLRTPLTVLCRHANAAAPGRRCKRSQLRAGQPASTAA